MEALRVLAFGIRRGGRSVLGRVATVGDLQGSQDVGACSIEIGAHSAGEDPVALYRRLAAEGRTRREAVKEAARRLGRSARDVYALVQEADAATRSS